MGQRNSKYDVIIDALKKHNIYDNLWDDWTLSRDAQIKTIYTILCTNAVHSDTIIDLSPQDYRKSEFHRQSMLDGYQYFGWYTFFTTLDYWECKFRINGIRFELYFSKLNSFWYIYPKICYAFIDIIHKKYERLLKNCSCFSIPNDIIDIIVKYL